MRCHFKKSFAVSMNKIFFSVICIGKIFFFILFKFAFLFLSGDYRYVLAPLMLVDGA